MNYLGHATLSFGESNVTLGNLISDFVKGKKQYDYPKSIFTGIRLHRDIDSFTDCHPSTASAKEFFRNDYPLYSGAFIDVVYDHFLALQENEFITYGGLDNFSAMVYDFVDARLSELPVMFQAMFPYMKKHDWLWNYRHEVGIMRSFQSIAFRAKYLNDSKKAFDIFIDKYEDLRELFLQFYPDVKKYSEERLRNLQTA